MWRKGLAATVVLAVGFAAGLVVSGRLDLTDSSDAAAPQADQAVDTPAAGRPSQAAALANLPDLSTIAERALDVSVNISSTTLVRVQRDPFFDWFSGGGRNTIQRSQSLGSGVIVSPDGYILTNTHVIGTNPEADIRVTLPDGQELPAEVVGIDQVSDLGVIKVDATDLPTIAWGDSSGLRVAEWVLAVGNPFQLSGTVTLGIVSTVARSGDQVGAVPDFIQTDAAINPGNSGGALINARGELVGINTMIYSETGGYQGIGFAIPSNKAREIMTELIEHGVVSWGSIGFVQMAFVPNESAARRYGLAAAGALVRRISTDSSAYRAGLAPADVIVAINDEPVTSLSQIDLTIVRQPVGGTLTLGVVKEDGRRLDLEVPVVARDTVGR